MTRRPPRSPLFPSRRSSDLWAGRILPEAARRGPQVASAVALVLMGTLVTGLVARAGAAAVVLDRKSTRLNSSHVRISYAVFCLKKKKKPIEQSDVYRPQTIS